MLIVHFSLSGTYAVKAIDLPSGDHFGPLGDSSTCVICVAGPSTSTYFTNSCAPFGSPSARYSNRLPSGDQRAFDPLSRNRFCEPSAVTIQSSESHLSSILLTCWRV